MSKIMRMDMDKLNTILEVNCKHCGKKDDYEMILEMWFENNNLKVRVAIECKCGQRTEWK